MIEARGNVTAPKKRKLLRLAMSSVVIPAPKATAKLKEAQASLVDAAKQFDQAASKRPRHVSDASAWSAFVKRLSDEVKGGPAGVTTTLPLLPGEQPGRPTAPPGVALPVEPAPPLSGETPPPPPDAGVPGGGVLL